MGQVPCPNADLMTIFGELTKLRSLQLEEHIVARIRGEMTFTVNWVMEVLTVSLERALVLPELLSLSFVIHRKDDRELGDDGIAGTGGEEDLSGKVAAQDRETFDDKIFTKMIVSRCSGSGGLCAKLEDVDLDFLIRGIEKQVWREMKELANREGISISATVWDY
jgi:hypothetical protein